MRIGFQADSYERAFRLLTMPAANAESKQSFSALRRIKAIFNQQCHSNVSTISCYYQCIKSKLTCQILLRLQTTATRTGDKYLAPVLRTLTSNNNTYYPVRICTAGLCVWSRPFVYIFIYTGAYEPPKMAKECATRDRLWVPSEYNQIHSSQLKTSLLGSFCAS